MNGNQYIQKTTANEEQHIKQSYKFVITDGSCGQVIPNPY